MRWLGAAWGPWRARLLRRATAVHVTSEAIRDHSPALRDLRDRCRVIPFGVDVEGFRRLASDADRITRHIGVLAEEIRNSHGVASFAYEAAHVFLCYP